MRRRFVGFVTGAKMDKTIRVEISWQAKHPTYGKYVRRRTVCYAHDEKNEARQGDRVEIAECRPRSKIKCWELVRVIERGPSAEAVPESTQAT